MKNIEKRIISLEKLLRSEKKESVVLIYYDLEKVKPTEIRVLGKTHLISPYEEPDSFIEKNLTHLLAEQCMFVYRPFKRQLTPPPQGLVTTTSYK